MTPPRTAPALTPPDSTVLRAGTLSWLFPRRSALAVALLAPLALLLITVAVAASSTGMSPSQTVSGLLGTDDPGTVLIVRDFRPPRVLVGLMVGAALGIAGCLTQTLAARAAGRDRRRGPGGAVRGRRRQPRLPGAGGRHRRVHVPRRGGRPGDVPSERQHRRRGLPAGRRQPQRPRRHRRHPAPGGPGVPGAAVPGRRHEALEATGTRALAAERLDRLSGGQRQRCWLAMVLAQQTPVVLLDEPTSALDLGHVIDVLSLVRTVAAAGRTVVMVLHDLASAARHADTVIAMKDGRVIAQGAPATSSTARW